MKDEYKMSETTTRKQHVIELITSAFYPGDDTSRTSILTRVLTSLTEEQLGEISRAIGIAFEVRKVSVVRDAVESRNLRLISAIAQYGTIVDLADLNGELNRQFGESDEMYDEYTETYDAHVEAFATYHSHCDGCLPYDRDMDYSAFDGTGISIPAETGHYLNYLQDYELMDLVEEHPEHVTLLVKFAAERSGIDPELVDELINPRGAALKEGLL